MSLQQRTFDWSAHERFARISRDYNPIHVDAITARRTHVGAPIVHGIHSLVWMLDCIAQSEPAAATARILKAQFLQPVYVGDFATMELSRPTSKSIRARILIGADEVAVASVGFEAPPQIFAPMPIDARRMSPPTAPQDLSLEEMEQMRGSLSFGPTSNEIADLFPAAARTFGVQRIAALVYSSCLVGMVVPGLHSIFSGLEVAFCDDDAPADELRFAVTSVAPRFRLVRIGIASRGLRGSLETVSRTPPVRQPSLDRVMSLVTRGEFRGSTALIVGGSRGLGELTGKLIAAGGGRVVSTYSAGKSDTDALVAEMRAAGLDSAAGRYDIHQPAAPQLAKLAVAPSQLYYFATPPIVRRKAGLFDADRFAEFNAFYVAGFFDLVQSCAQLRPGGVRAFYPSTTFIEARPANATEYSMSKAAAEILCADLTKFVPGVQVVSRRLPRLPTDQTGSVPGITAMDPIEVLLPIVREMHS